MWASTYALSAPIIATAMTEGMPGRICAATNKTAPTIAALQTIALRVNGVRVASMKYLRWIFQPDLHNHARTIIHVRKPDTRERSAPIRGGSQPTITAPILPVIGVPVLPRGPRA